MNQHWRTKKLVEVATLQRGFDLPTQNRVNGSVPLLSSSGLSDTHDKVAVRGPGVVTGRSGSVGNVFFVEEDFWPLNTVLYVKDFHGNDPRFVFYLLKNFDLQRFASGTGVPTLNRNSVHDELVSTPCLSEQQRIAAVLDEVHEQIAAAVKLTSNSIERLHSFLRSALNSLTPAREHLKPFTIADVAAVYDGPHATPKTVQTGPIFLGISALQNGLLNLDETRHVSEEDFLRWTRRVTPREDDFVFSYETRLGEAALIPEGLKCCLGRRMGLARFDTTRVNPQYFLYLYRSSSFQEFLNMKTIRGATVDRLSIKDFPSFPILLPSLFTQKEVVKKLNVLRVEAESVIQLRRRKLNALLELEQSLMHQAFSGNL